MKINITKAKKIAKWVALGILTVAIVLLLAWIIRWIGNIFSTNKASVETAKAEVKSELAAIKGLLKAQEANQIQLLGKLDTAQLANTAMSKLVESTNAELERFKAAYEVQQKRNRDEIRQTRKAVDQRQAQRDSLRERGRQFSTVNFNQ